MPCAIAAASSRMAEARLLARQRPWLHVMHDQQPHARGGLTSLDAIFSPSSSLAAATLLLLDESLVAHANATKLAHDLSSVASASGKRQPIIVATPPPIAVDAAHGACNGKLRRSDAAATIRRAALQSPQAHLVDFEDALLSTGHTLAIAACRSAAVDVLSVLVDNWMAAACSSDSPPSAPPPPPRIAVCMGGWLGTVAGLTDGGESIRQYLVEPLGDRVDVLLALRYEKLPAECGSGAPSAAHPEGIGALVVAAEAQACAASARQALRSLGRIHRLHIEPSPSLRGLVQTLEALPHWPAILHAYNSGAREPYRSLTRPKVCTRARAWRDERASPYACTNVWNSFLSPIFASDVRSFGHNLNVLLDVSRALHALTAAEAAGGFRYDRVVSSRLDFRWYAPHPPAWRLPPSRVWIPEGSDFYGGLNDRHALLSRGAAELLMRRYEYILDGTVLHVELEHMLYPMHACTCASPHVHGMHAQVLHVDRQLRDGAITNTMLLNGENYVRSTLVYFGLKAGRFKNTAALPCCTHCSHPECHRHVLPTASAVRTACAALPPLAPPLPPPPRALLLPRHEARHSATAVPPPPPPPVDLGPKVSLDGARLITGKHRAEVCDAWRSALLLQLPGAEHAPLEDALRMPVQRHAVASTAALRVPHGALFAAVAPNATAAASLGPSTRRAYHAAAHASAARAEACLTRLWRRLGDEKAARAMACTADDWCRLGRVP